MPKLFEEETIILGGSVEWGPDFGGVDGDQLTGGVSITQPHLALDSTQGVQGSLTMPTLAVDASHTVQAGLVADSLALFASQDVGGSVSLVALSADLTALTIGSAVTMPTVAVDGAHTIAGSVTLPSLALDHTSTVGVDVSTLEYRVIDYIASKDTWAPDVAGCVDNANKNASPLQVEGTAATKKNTFLGWDVTSFPSNATVSTGTLRLVVNAAPTINSVSITPKLIPTGSETWTETGLTCSNQPGQDGNGAANFTVTTADGAGLVKTSDLDAAGRTRLAARMGAGSFSLRLDTGALDVATFRDKDTGAAADRPRLSFTFTVPV